MPWLRAPPCGFSWRQFVDAVLPQEAAEGMAEDNTAAAAMVSSCIPFKCPHQGVWGEGGVRVFASTSMLAWT